MGHTNKKSRITAPAPHRVGRSGFRTDPEAPGSADAPTVIATALDESEEMDMANLPGGGDLLTFPPIPLATGQMFADAEGKPVQITKVEVVVTSEDGTESRIPLTSLHGGWWARVPG